jgi:hypothetical protein
MSRIKRIQQVVSGFSVSVSVVAAQQTALWVASHSIDFPQWLPPAVAVVVFSMGSVAIRSLLEFSLENMVLLRRVLLGKQFIEGLWFELIFQDNHPVAIGHSNISYSDGKFLFGGEDFRLDGSNKGHFRVDLVELSWPVLRYKYTYETGLERDSGYGEAQFIERDDGPPLKFNGSFVSLRDGSRFTFETVRIKDPDLIRRFHRDLGRYATILSYLQPLIEERSREGKQKMATN